MVVTNRFSFVHLHKSGGSFVSAVLLRFLASARRIGYHYPLAALPEAYHNLPVLGCVRNPWDFYVSYYFFQLGLLEQARDRNARMSSRELEAWSAAGNDPFNGIDVLFAELSDGGSLGFAATTHRLLRLGVDDGSLDLILGRMPTTRDRRGRSTPPQVDGFRGMNVRADELATIRGTGEGLYSFLFRHMHGGARGSIHFLRMESLRDDLLSYLHARDVEATPEMEHFVLESGRMNTSRHSHYSSYYDDKLAALVNEHDGTLVQRFGYHFELGLMP